MTSNHHREEQPEIDTHTPPYVPEHLYDSDGGDCDRPILPEPSFTQKAAFMERVNEALVCPPDAKKTAASKLKNEELYGSSLSSVDSVDDLSLESEGREKDDDAASDDSGSADADDASGSSSDVEEVEKLRRDSYSSVLPDESISSIRVLGFSRHSSDGKKPYTVYTVEVVTEFDGCGWHVHKRFSEFTDLHKDLSKIVGGSKIPSLPTRLSVGLSERFMKEESRSPLYVHRMKHLQAYLDALMEVEEAVASLPFRKFLESPENCTNLRRTIALLQAHLAKQKILSARQEREIERLKQVETTLKTAKRAASSSSKKGKSRGDDSGSIADSTASSTVSEASSPDFGLTGMNQAGKVGMIQKYVNMILRPPRFQYSMRALGNQKFEVGRRPCYRTDFTVTNRSGHTLQCSYYNSSHNVRNSEKSPCVVYSHGNSGSRCDGWPLVVESLLVYGISVVTFDFAGCGMSDGDFLTLGYNEQYDIGSVVEWVRSSGMATSVGLWGRSMGAVAALMYASSDSSIACVVVDSPFSSLKQLMADTAKQGLPTLVASLGVSMLSRSIKNKAGFEVSAVDAVSAGKLCKMPCVFGHGRDDKLISPAHTDTIFQGYAGPKHKFLFSGKHNSRRPDFFTDLLGVFFNFSLNHHNSDMFYELITNGTQSAGQISSLVRASRHKYQLKSDGKRTSLCFAASK